MSDVAYQAATSVCQRPRRSPSGDEHDAAPERRAGGWHVWHGGLLHLTGMVAASRLPRRRWVGCSPQAGERRPRTE